MHDDHFRERLEQRFDSLLLSATKLRMIGDQGRQDRAEIDTGDADTDIRLRELLSDLIGRTEQLADRTDEVVRRHHPLRDDDT